MRKKYKFLEEKTSEELERTIMENKANLLAFRMQHARGVLKSPSVLRETRKLIARMNTLLTIKRRSGE